MFSLVKSLVDNLINPLIGIFVQDGALAKLTFKLGNATFAYGKFLNDVLNFLIKAFVIFILIKTINNFFMTSKKEEEVVEDVIVTEEVETLREIRDLLKQK